MTADKNTFRFENMPPSDIERRSFEIITKEAGERLPKDDTLPFVLRAVHTTADFDYIDSLCFSDGAVNIMKEAVKNGACIVTDTNMARAGINKKRLAEYGGEVYCFMADADVAENAAKKGTTRAWASMDKAAKLNKPCIIAVGNAPTALIRLYDLITEHGFQPAGIIGVPVGFVNVEAAKELIMTANIPYIVARGRKGGSNVAAALCNAILYNM